MGLSHMAVAHPNLFAFFAVDNRNESNSKAGFESVSVLCSLSAMAVDHIFHIRPMVPSTSVLPNNLSWFCSHALVVHFCSSQNCNSHSSFPPGTHTRRQK